MHCCPHLVELGGLQGHLQKLQQPPVHALSADVEVASVHRQHLIACTDLPEVLVLP